MWRSLLYTQLQSPRHCSLTAAFIPTGHLLSHGWSWRRFVRSTPLHVHDADRVTGRKSWAWESEARSAQTQLWFVMMSHTNMLVHAITICWLCLWKWPRGFSHSNWGVKKFSDVANEVENTQTLRLQNYIHERLCSDDESTHFIVVGGLSNIKRWCSNSGGSFPQKIHSAQTNKQTIIYDIFKKKSNIMIERTSNDHNWKGGISFAWKRT